MFPEDYLTYTNRGIAYRATGRYDLALADFARAIELAPNEAGGYTSLGSVYEETGDYQLALAEYDKVVELLPDNSQGYIGRAGVLTAIGESIRRRWPSTTRLSSCSQTDRRGLLAVRRRTAQWVGTTLRCRTMTRW